MSDQDLDAWRAKRTGKKQQQQPVLLIDAPSNSGGGPEMSKPMRSPTDGLVEPDFLNDQQEQPSNEPAPQNQEPHASNELEDLRQQLAAAQGRLSPAQRQLEEMRAAHEANQRQLYELQSQLAERQAQDATAKAKQAAENFNPFEGFTQDEIDMLDPTAVKFIEKASRNAYSKAAMNNKDPEELIQKALAQRDARAKDNYIRATADTLGLVKLSSDPKFQKFLAEDDSAGILMNSFVAAPDLESARGLEQRVRTMLKRFEKSTTTTTRTPDPQDRLSAHLDRASDGQSFQSRRPATPEEARRISEEAKRLMRARKFDEANKLLASINN